MQVRQSYFGHLNLVFVSDFVLRISDVGAAHLPRRRARAAAELG
jgi:hypothetical protein